MKKYFCIVLALSVAAGVFPAQGRAAGPAASPAPPTQAVSAALTPPAITTAAAAAVAPAAPRPSPLSVYFLEVGNADATVITTPGGKCVLIDAGGGRKGGAAVLSFLMDKGIEKIDTIVMSHADSDHIGGMPAVFEAPFLIGEFIDPGFPHTTKLYERVLESVQAREGTRYRNVKAGDILDWGPELMVRVLSPSENPRSTNDSSIVIQLHYGSVSLLFTGDAEKSAENKMIKRSGNGLKSRILKVAHHGSKSSSSEPFLRAVKPKVAIVSTKSTDPDGPYEEVIDRLREAGAKVFQTGIYGMITVVSDGKGYRVLMERSPDKPAAVPVASPARGTPAVTAPPPIPSPTPTGGSIVWQ